MPWNNPNVVVTVDGHFEGGDLVSRCLSCGFELYDHPRNIIRGTHYPCPNSTDLHALTFPLDHEYARGAIRFLAPKPSCLDGVDNLFVRRKS